MNGDLDDLLLQRLVDGEINDEQRCRFLTTVDRRPELWRTVALAFVEDQLWHAALGRNGSRRRPQISSAPASPADRTATRRGGLILAAAASLLVVLGLGYQIGRHDGLRQRLAAVRGSSMPNEQRAAEPVAAGQVPDGSAAPYRLKFLCGGDARDQSLELPVYDASVVGESELQRALWQEPDAKSVEALNRELANRGYRVDWSTEYLSRNLNGGRCLLVPLQTVAIQYHGQ